MFRANAPPPRASFAETLVKIARAGDVDAFFAFVIFLGVLSLATVLAWRALARTGTEAKGARTRVRVVKTVSRKATDGVDGNEDGGGGGGSSLRASPSGVSEERRPGSPRSPHKFGRLSSWRNSFADEDLLSPRSYGAPPPPVHQWPQRPMYLTIPPYAACEHLSGDLTVNGEIPIEFETSLFKGKLICRFKGFKTPPNAAKGAKERVDGYFRGKKRLFQYVVQGQFKREVDVGEAFSGHEFVKPLEGIPSKFIVKTILKFLRSMNPGIQMNLFTARPRIWSSLAGTAQVISADAPGREPDISRVMEIKENTARLGGVFAKKPHSSRKRRRIFSNARLAHKYTFSPDDVYTFDFYQHLFDPVTYSLQVGGVGVFRVDFSKHSAGQPAQMMARTSNPGEYLFCFCLWHEKVFRSLERAASRDAPPESKPKSRPSASSTAFTPAHTRAVTHKTF